MTSTTTNIPSKQTVALVRQLGGPVEFVDDYPVPQPGRGQVLAKVLYTGVCQSDLHTKSGTASGADGAPITAIKLPHIGGHEGVGRIVQLGPDVAASEIAAVGQLVGIRFLARVCGRCEHCRGGCEQHCARARNHLHHVDGAFQQYALLDAGYLTVLPDGVDPALVGPVLCAGLTTYKAVLNARIKPGQWVVVVGAAGGLGHLAVQYAVAHGARVIGIDGGGGSTGKAAFVTETLGAELYLDFTAAPPAELTARVRAATAGGAHAVVVAAGSAPAFARAADMLRVHGVLSCVGIPPGDDAYLKTSIATIVIKGLTVTGNLVGSLKECLEAVDFVKRGVVKPKVQVREFRELPKVYEEMEQGKIEGRVVLRIGGE